VLLEQVARVGVHEDRLSIRLKPAGDEQTSDAADDLLSIPWLKPPSRKSREDSYPARRPQKRSSPDAHRTSRAPRECDRRRPSMA
jgi:hypothetical protein